MIVVLDTNVIISAMGKVGSFPGIIENLWRHGIIKVAVNEEILAELKETLNKGKIKKWLNLANFSSENYIESI